MHWLLEPKEQDRIRRLITDLQKSLSATSSTRDQSEQVFPFLGRKNRAIAAKVINFLCPKDGVVCDPFAGSGTFLYAALDCNRDVRANEWEPYAWRMTTSPFRKLPTDSQLKRAVALFKAMVGPRMFDLYKTKCPSCGRELMFDGLFFDRAPPAFQNPVRHDRMGPDGENVIFRNQYECPCGCREKHFDSFDQSVLDKVECISVPFPDDPIIPNSRLNFTPPNFTHYAGLFSKRQQAALMEIVSGIKRVDKDCRDFFFDTFLSIVHLGKYSDYRSKSQDNHCPPQKLKETNLYHRFLERITTRSKFIRDQQGKWNKSVDLFCRDFRDFLKDIPDCSISLLLTDPPYGDTAQYFEHAQRVHPFLPYSLSADSERLKKEVVVSNSPNRPDKHGKDQFFQDIACLFSEAKRVLCSHGWMSLYFRPEQTNWIQDLNRLKVLARSVGFEPIIMIPLDQRDPSMRALASAAWTFQKDVLMIFLRLSDSERRWYENGVDIDEVVFLAATDAATDQGDPFMKKVFNQALLKRLRAVNLIHLAAPAFESRISQTLLRFAEKQGAQYRLTGAGPYYGVLRGMDAESRLYEFAPEVVKQLSAEQGNFTFEDFVIKLSSYVENGSKAVIDRLSREHTLVPDLLREFAEENPDGQSFRAIIEKEEPCDTSGLVNVRKMDPKDFETLVGAWLTKRGYTNVSVIGQCHDRGVDVLATSPTGDREMFQCKRYRKGNNVNIDPIQKIHSLLHTRGAKKGWVVTTSDFTPDAKDEAQLTKVQLINGSKLIKSLERYFPGKYTL